MTIGLVAEQPPHPRPLSPKGERVARDAAFSRRRGTGEGVRLANGTVVT
jgi:hypothetical protein